MACTIEFAASVRTQLRALSARERETILDAVEIQLGSEPLRETRNRKPLRPNPVAPWELRVGALSVFYDVTGAPPNRVRILAVGKKVGDALRIGKKEVWL